MASGRETPQHGSEEHARPLVVAADRLAAQIASVLRAWGIPDDHVTVTVDRILYADLRGIDSHGCTTLAFYQRLRADGVLNPRATVTVIRNEGATTLVDGGGGLGHVPATRAMEIAIEIAAAHGIGAVAVCNSGHFGAAGAYAAMAADRGLIGIATTSTPTPTVVPTFGRQAMLGTNPIAFAAPARRHPMFLLDMTLSGGQKQRLFIALALINDPELVFLDELTTGLDPQARRAIWDLVRGIRDRGKTVFLTTHLMEEAERLCDRVAVIDRGRIVDMYFLDRSADWRK